MSARLPPRTRLHEVETLWVVPNGALVQRSLNGRKRLAINACNRACEQCVAAFAAAFTAQGCESHARRSQACAHGTSSTSAWTGCCG